MMTEVLIARQMSLKAKEAFDKRSKTRERAAVRGWKLQRDKEGGKGDTKTTKLQIEFGQFHAYLVSSFITLPLSF